MRGELWQALREAQEPWEAGVQERAASLPETLRALVQDFADLANHRLEHRRPPEEVFDALGALPDAERLALFGVLFPRFPEIVAGAWQTFLTRLPYPTGHARRAFRAPGHAVQTRRAGQWLLAAWLHTRVHPRDLAWFAVHAAHLHAEDLGYLFAAALDAGDEAIFEVLRRSASAEHPVARMGRHVTRALLSSARPDAWEYAEKLLLAAQRQEGLRQVILETIDEAHPDAYVRMLRLLLDEDLLRFAAAVRAAGVWFGLGYDVTDAKTLRGTLARALVFLEDPQEARRALGEGAPQDAFLALFTLAHRDAPGALTEAVRLLDAPDVERRFAAAHFLAQLDLPEVSEHHVRLLTDPDPRVGAVAFSMLGALRWGRHPQHAPLWDALVAYGGRVGEVARHAPLLFPWLGHVPARAAVFDALPGLLGDRPLSALLPFLGELSPWGRRRVVEFAEERAKLSPLDADVRAAVLALLQDRSPDVSGAAVRVAERLDLDDAEARGVEALLTRKSADLRRGLIKLLVKREGAAGSAARLLAARGTEQRQAGLQLLIDLRERGRPAPLPDFVPRDPNEAQLHARLLGAPETLTLDDGLGTFDPSALAPLPTLHDRPHDYPADLARGRALLQSLDDLVHEHRETPVAAEGGDGRQTALLGNLNRWVFQALTPLREVWLDWWHARPDPRPGDLARLRWAAGHEPAPRFFWEGETPAPSVHPLFGELADLDLKYEDLCGEVLILLWREARVPEDDVLSFDAWETALARLDRDVRPRTDRPFWSQVDPRAELQALDPVAWRSDAEPTEEELRRLWDLRVYTDRAFPNLPRLRPDLHLVALAADRGWASRHDLLDHLIGPREVHGYGQTFGTLQAYSTRHPDVRLPHHPRIDEAVEIARARVLEVELARGDLETPATPAAHALRFVPGARAALTALARLGDAPLARGWTGRSEGKVTTLSHLVRVSFPAEGDTPDAVRALSADLGLGEARLLDLATYAPQWAPLVGNVLGWEGLADGVYWLHAHTKDPGWSVPADVREAWTAEIGERTPLSAQELLDGAVDVAWFHAAHDRLGAERFHRLLDSSAYTSSGLGHKRALLFREAILGLADEPTLEKRILVKRHQDSVRALGLLPVAGQDDVVRRFAVLRDFRRGARQFGAMRQASEALAADIGTANLARSAGYPDPQRLTWAMEARAADEWTLAADVDGVSVRVEVDGEGGAELVVKRGERALKSVPPALRKHADVQAVQATLKTLREGRSRMREAFEAAMVRGDLFRPEELVALARHPVVAPMLRALVWVANGTELGLWREGVLETLTGPSPVGDRALRLAHPHDLFASGDWRAWQALLFDRALRQPFKQVFREYYPLTPAERGAKRTARYEGHHVGPQRAMGLFKTRGWLAVDGEGVRRTFHGENVNAWVDTAVAFGTPGEVEGVPVGAVSFAARDTGDLLDLAAVPPRVFSEVMRDLDLVVSVAHVGGVDPEASRSTTGMRAALIEETARLLGLGNVRVRHDHALIAGHYHEYSVHLGSGVVHTLPGGALCIVPVHNQQQGRIFLPFADPDPKTAEVTSKVLLLARDRSIQDPTILEQLV